MPPMPMIGNLHRLRRFPDQLDGDRLDARAGQAAGDVGQLGPARLDVNRHRRETVHDGQRVAAGVLRRFGVRRDARRRSDSAW